MGGSRKGEHRGNARKRPDTPNDIMRQAVRGEAPARHKRRGADRRAHAATVEERIEIYRVVHGGPVNVRDMMPKEVLLDIMHDEMQAVVDWKQMLLHYASLPPTAENTRMVVRCETELERMRDRAKDAAREAAPYINPKLAAVKVVGGDDRPADSIMQDLLDEIDRREREAPPLLEHTPQKRIA